MIIEPDSIVLVVMVDGEPAAAATVHPDKGVSSGWTLVRLYVDPSHWSIGLGTKLHDSMLVKLTAVAKPPDTINLWVLEHNDKARASYQSRGWALVLDLYLANKSPHVRDVLYQRPIYRPEAQDC